MSTAPVMSALRSTAPYDPPTGAPKAVVVVLDGLLAPPESPFSWEEPGQARLREAMEATLAAFYLASHEIIVISTLPDGADHVRRRLAARKVRHDKLLMRPEPAMYAPDAEVKLALFNRHVRAAYDVVAVLDGHADSVEMWRSLGIPCFQVALAEL